jgi:CRP/FNR family transcriptional regulator
MSGHRIVDLTSEAGVPTAEWQRGPQRKLGRDEACVEWKLQRAFSGDWRRPGAGGKVVDRGREIISAGTPCHQVYRLLSGFAFRARPLAEGRRAILDIYRPGEFIGLDELFFARALDDVIALTNASYWALEHRAVHELMQQPGVALWLMRHLAMEKRRVDGLATLLGQAKACERTAALLLFLWRRRKLTSAGAAGEKEASAKLPLTQKHLADYLGLNVIHLNRTLAGLRDRGILRFQNGVIIIHDAIRLMQIAGEAAAPLRPSRRSAMAIQARRRREMPWSS